jgi:GTP cyclohydrolase I
MILAKQNNSITKTEAEEAIRVLLQYVGENPAREGLVETPRRVVESFEERLQGYHSNPHDVLQKGFTDVAGYNEMILLKDIRLESTCEHHLLPFIGKVHIAYIPGDKIVGISKLARTADILAKRLQVQERLTMQIATAIMDALKAKGVAVVMEAKHYCMCVRGVHKKSSKLITSAFLGEYSEPENKTKFLQLIK